MHRVAVGLVFLLLTIPLNAAGTGEPVARSATGDLEISIWSIPPNVLTATAAPGDTVVYWISYEWAGEEAAPGVQVDVELPVDVDLVTAYPVASSSTGQLMTWNLGELDTGEDGGSIIITTIIRESTPIGSTLLCRASISGDVTDDDPENNTFEDEIEVKAGAPSFFLWAMPAVEDTDWFFAFYVEKEVPFSVVLTYGNISGYEAEDARLAVELPVGVALSGPSIPATSSNTDRVVWDFGTMEGWEFGEMTFSLQASETGEYEVPIIMSSIAMDGTPVADTTTLSMEVKELLQPRLLKPNASAASAETPLILGANPRFEGLARAGATVTLYEGVEGGCIGAFENCSPVPIGAAVAAADRRWTIEPMTLTEAQPYHLYLRAEYEGQYSEPTSFLFTMWDPLVVTIDSLFSGFDFDNFTVGNGDVEYRPGALGGRSGALPDEDYVVKMRMKAPDDIASDSELLENHRLVFKVFEGGEVDSFSVLPTDIVPAGETDGAQGPVVQPDATEAWVMSDFIYVQKGFGPGSVVEVWCRPVYYPENPGEAPLVGLVWVKCHETVIDPAGYVYDYDVAEGCDYEWPSIPPSDALIRGAEVTALQRQGDVSWGVWDASVTGQVNPQVTDSLTDDRITIPGYFAFYVPSGQYQVRSVAPGYVDYTSPILTVVDSPVFHNVCMRASRRQSTAINQPHLPRRTVKPGGFVLAQNFPNPFSASTIIPYELSVAANVSITIYNVAGQELARIDPGVQQPGLHQVRFDASRFSSGVYFYRLQVEDQSEVGRMMVIH